MLFLSLLDINSILFPSDLSVSTLLGFPSHSVFASHCSVSWGRFPSDAWGSFIVYGHTVILSFMKLSWTSGKEYTCVSSFRNTGIKHCWTGTGGASVSIAQNRVVAMGHAWAHRGKSGHSETLWLFGCPPGPPTIWDHTGLLGPMGLFQTAIE